MFQKRLKSMMPGIKPQRDFLILSGSIRMLGSSLSPLTQSNLIFLTTLTSLSSQWIQGLLRTNSTQINIQKCKTSSMISPLSLITANFTMEKAVQSVKCAKRLRKNFTNCIKVSTSIFTFDPTKVISMRICQIHQQHLYCNYLSNFHNILHSIYMCFLYLSIL